MFTLSDCTRRKPDSTAATIGPDYLSKVDLLTPQIRFGLQMAEQLTSFDGIVKNELARKRLTETMWRIFEQADLVICATNPDTAFGAKGPMPQEVEGKAVPLKDGQLVDRISKRYVLEDG